MRYYTEMQTRNYRLDGSGYATLLHALGMDSVVLLVLTHAHALTLVLIYVYTARAEQMPKFHEIYRAMMAAAHVDVASSHLEVRTRPLLLCVIISVADASVLFQTIMFGLAAWKDKYADLISEIFEEVTPHARITLCSF